MATGGQSETLKRFKALAEEVLGVTDRAEQAVKLIGDCREGMARSAAQMQESAERMRSREVELEYGYVRLCEQMGDFTRELASLTEGHKRVGVQVERFASHVERLQRPWTLYGLLAVMAGSLVAGGIVGAVLSLGLQGLER